MFFPLWFFFCSLKIHSLSKHSLSNRDNGDFIGHGLAHADLSPKQKCQHVYSRGIWPAGRLYWILKYKIKPFVIIAFTVKKTAEGSDWMGNLKQKHQQRNITKS